MTSASWKENHLVKIFVFATFHLYGQFYIIRIQNRSKSENIDVLQRLCTEKLFLRRQSLKLMDHYQHVWTTMRCL
jgi:hypothetical protein